MDDRFTSRWPWRAGGDILSKMDYLKDFVESEAHMIFEFAATGGFENASNF